MSIPDLEARVEGLSWNIERQREILRKLERDKSLVQRQLNAARDPVARLPLEISSEIFLQCIPPQPVPEADKAPMFLLNVCNTWTDIALSVPALWSKIWIPKALESLTAEALTAGMERWLRRAGTGRLLDITMERPLDSVVASLIGHYSSRLERLDICVCSSSADDNLQNANIFDVAQLEPRLPFLRTLIFRPSPSHQYRGEFPVPTVFHLLRAAPELTELSVSALSVLIDPVGKWTAEVVLPNLRRLEYGYDYFEGAGALRYLSTPRLEFLSLDSLESPDSDIVSFLQRSSPPLREVIIEQGAVGTELAAMFSDFLSLLPFVTRLKIGHLDKTGVETVFNTLTQTRPGALPSLQTLELFNMGDWSDWSLVSRALSARRAVLRFVNLDHEYHYYAAVPWSLDAGIRDELCELLADSEMDIRIRGVQNRGGNVVQLFP
ncbi:hypothetical protein FB45DRAFT_359769 [Roridomyces roridus]|uniref:F-box domain-containing protein n=1 Tax=Roridomyces roridus TaxID=1738132 RepID=A0AAD7FVL8_9AGAR|nr:hypothetical protein FB45DRAFT_359769 [Roridomyces roridus]